jgi:hypothetical protein
MGSTLVHHNIIGYMVLEGAGIAVDMIGHRLAAVKHLDLK